MSRDLNLLNPFVKSLAEKLLLECKRQGIEIIITQTYRTYEEQDELYAQGRTKQGNIVTNAKGGYSVHNYGYAFDIAVIKDGKVSWDTNLYIPIGKIGKSIELEWGGDFKSIKDYPHFQFTQGLSIQDFIKGKRPNCPNIEEKIERIVNSMNIIDLQKFLNKIGITSNDGNTLKEDGLKGTKTNEAVAKAKEILTYIMK